MKRQAKKYKDLSKETNNLKLIALLSDLIIIVLFIVFS